MLMPMNNLTPVKANGPVIRVRERSTIAQLRDLARALEGELNTRVCLADAAAVAIAEALKARTPAPRVAQPENAPETIVA